MLITLIRHSKTKIEKNVSNLNWILSTEGVTLAKKFANRNEIKELDIIYSSNQNKAVETMVLLAKPNRTPLRTHENLTETTSVTNGFIGEKFEETMEKYLLGEIDEMNGGETTYEALERFNSAIYEIVSSNHGDKNIGIVAHGTVLSLFADQFDERSALDIHKTIKMPDVAVLDWEDKVFLKKFG